jgi:hypothetical protein
MRGNLGFLSYRKRAWQVGLFARPSANHFSSSAYVAWRSSLISPNLQEKEP